MNKTGYCLRMYLAVQEMESKEQDRQSQGFLQQYTNHQHSFDLSCPSRVEVTNLADSRLNIESVMQPYNLLPTKRQLSLILMLLR